MEIFVIDDEADIAELIRDVLVSEGFTVTAYTDSSMLLAEITKSVNLVISDVDMGEGDGFILAQKIDKLIGHNPPRTLLMSARTHTDKMKAAAYKSILGIIKKPFNLSDFLSIVKILATTRDSCPCRIKKIEPISNYNLSKIPAMPWPPPTQAVTIPYR